MSSGRVALDGPAGGELAGTSLDMVKAMAVTNQVLHLRWSQAPPLPWPRPGSADITNLGGSGPIASGWNWLITYYFVLFHNNQNPASCLHCFGGHPTNAWSAVRFEQRSVLTKSD